MNGAMPTGTLFYLVGGIAVFILGLSKGGFAGVGMVSTPLLALVVGPVTAAGTILPILLVQDAIAVTMYRRTFNADILLTMIPGAALGVVIAFLFAASVPGPAVEIVLGMISLLFAAQQLNRLMRKSAVPSIPGAPKRWLGVLSGVGSGFASMVAHAGTPPFQFYVMPKRLDRDMYIGTSVIFFAATNWMKVPAFSALGQLSLTQMKPALVFLPLAIVSSWLGVRLVRLVDVEKFNLAITLILLCIGVTLIGQGVLELQT
jgi:uncharacterized membrane protein YfcA